MWEILGHPYLQVFFIPFFTGCGAALIGALVSNLSKHSEHEVMTDRRLEVMEQRLGFIESEIKKLRGALQKICSSLGVILVDGGE